MLSNSFNRSLTGNQSSKQASGSEALVSSSIIDSTSLASAKPNKSVSNGSISLMSANGNANLLNNSFSQALSYEFNEEQEQCLHYFDKWSPIEQTEFVENLLRRMCHFQHGHINNFLKPMLQRDFISSLPGMCVLSWLIFFKFNLIVDG